MNKDRAIRMLERGDAYAVVTQVILLSCEDRMWMSFDGEDWEETESKMIRKELE